MGSALLNIGTKAMFANYAALQATSNNIANANTKGYSRQSVELASAGGQFSGAGFFGKGVDVTTVSRAHSEFLTREAASSRAVAAADQTRAEQLAQLEKIFDTGEAGIGHAAGQFLNAFVDVANNPQDLSARQVALARAEDVAARFRAAGEQIDAMQSAVTQDLKTSVAAINSLAARVADINSRIAVALGSGHTPNDLMDQRDQMISDISSYVQVTTLEADDGSISVFVGGGQRLVLGGEATTLVTVPDEFDPGIVRVGVANAGGATAFPDNLITGGSIAGLLNFQQNDLKDARNLLGQMAAALAGRVNEQQALGLDLSQPATAGAPIFSTGAPGVSPGRNNAKDASGIDIASYVNASGVRVPSVSLTVTSPSELRASAYELRPDPATAGNYLVTRQSDGQTVSVASGTIVDGFLIDVVAPLPVAGDRFLLQPVGSAALNMQVVLGDPKGIAAASPMTASVDPDNTGTATIGEVHAVSTTMDPTLTATLTFSSDTGDYDWELRDPANTLISSGSATWQAGQPITLNGWSMQLNGVPKSGDLVSVQPTAFPANDNGNARALTALRDTRLVGIEMSGATVVARGETISDAYANALADFGVRVQGAEMTAQMSQTVATEAEASRTAKTGVNLDEEAARLIQFQQSYQAAAKMLQVAQSVFDTLLDVAGR